MGVVFWIGMVLGVGLSVQGQAEPLYSYVNEQGVKVFTNIGLRPPPPAAPASPARPRQDPPAEYLALIEETAGRHGIDKNLVQAIVTVESNYDPHAISPKGCLGLMQLHPDTARRFGVRDSFDPMQNMEGGVRYLNFLMGEFGGDLDLVLAAYNAGEKAVERYRGIPPYRETRNYVRRVSALYQTLGPSAKSGPKRRPPALHRVALPDGSVLFTNWATPERLPAD